MQNNKYAYFQQCYINILNLIECVTLITAWLEIIPMNTTYILREGQYFHLY